jgi:type II secretory pathway pseudopilin PulG
MDATQRGATLTELVVVAAVIALIVGGLVPLFSLGQQTWSAADKQADMLHNGRRALDKIVRDLRAAQSFQAVTPVLLRFRMALGDGTGAMPTVEYQLNAATGEMEYRTSADYAYRRRITASAPLLGAPAGYSVSVVFDHAALVAAGRSLASGDDVRILYWNGTTWIELDRVKDVPTAWNTTTTRLWFRLQAAIPLLGSDNNYYLHYGDVALPPPPANGDYVFLDYEDGTTLADWTRRDTIGGCTGTLAASADGFVFTSAAGSCYRQYAKPVSHGDVEIFWGFRSTSAGATSNRHQVGMSARRDNAGQGYMVVPGENNNQRLRIRFTNTWNAAGSIIAQTANGFPVTPGTDYYGRFYLVGTTLRAKYWVVGAAEPAWILNTVHLLGPATGLHYGQVDGLQNNENHRHRYLIIRQRIDPEPTTAVGAEENGARADVPQPLAGPFRSMAVQCFDASGTAVACASAAAVRAVQVSLTVMDPTGEVADVVVTARAYRQAP